MFMADSPEFVASTWPRCGSARCRCRSPPCCTPTALAELLRDSRARFLAVTAEFADRRGRGRAPAPELPGMLAPVAAGRHRHAAGARAGVAGRRPGRRGLPDRPRTRPRSGSTPPARPGSPRRAMHRHGSVQVVCETYGAAGARHPPGRPVPVRGQGLLRLRAGQLAAVPALASGRPRCWSRRRPGRTRWPTGPGVRRHAVLRRADVLRQHAARRAARRRAGRGAAGRVGRRGAAGRAVPAVDRALRRRHPRRHRHDRDAAHLPVQPARRGPRRAPPASRCPATTCGSLDDDGRDGRRRARPGTLLRPRRVDRHRLLVPLRRLPAGVPGRVAAHRRHLRARTPTATTPASAAPATCSRPAASGSSPAEVEERLLAHDAVGAGRRRGRARRRRAGEAGRVRRAAAGRRARPRTS